MFARVERSHVGIHHRFSGKYLDWYMAMVAWKTDTRYMGLKWQLADILRTVTHRTTSANLCGYWQGAAARTRYGHLKRKPSRRAICGKASSSEAVFFGRIWPDSHLSVPIRANWF